MRTLGIAAIAAASIACGSNGSASSQSDAGHLDSPVRIEGPCDIFVDTPPLSRAEHVDMSTQVTYSSNPPSSGPHFAYWAAFQTFAKPVDRRYYVHDLEHGAVVLLYKCGAADGCPDVVRALEEAANALPTDPACTSAGEGVRVRTVVTPDPLLDVPIAAAAWGWTYKAACVDAPSLAAFVKAHYANGPENFCSNGITL